MHSKKSYIPLKVFVSYLAIAVLVISVGWLLYTENQVFSKNEAAIAQENNKILKVGNLLASIYKTENLSRITIQSDASKDFENYTTQTAKVKLQIDSLKTLVKTKYQITLLDSVRYLLSKKTANILELKRIKRQSVDEAEVKKSIQKLANMKESLSKLRLEDVAKDTSALKDYEKRMWKNYITYMNENIKDDPSNSLSHKASDSLLAASGNLLNNVRRKTENRKAILDAEERKLLQNELSISEQLRKVLVVVEREIVSNTTKISIQKEQALKRTNDIVSTAAIIGLILTLFFSIIILTDFLKTQSYKKQLEIANLKTQTLLKNREQLISTVSHDLKTPLSTIIGYSELLENSALTSKQHYYTKNIRNSSEYISKLVHDLLDFTKIESGKIVVEIVSFSLEEIIRNVAFSVQSVYQSKPIELKINIDNSFTQKKINSDPFRLQQILTNIVGNAYKFTETGCIEITAKPDISNKKAIITIQDSGIGIEEKNLNLVFEEFTQAEDNIEKHYGGSGLGLTISKKMTEILGGKLSLSSTFGKGSTFEILLPIEFGEPILKDKSNPKSFANDGLTAILLDDDENLLKLTTEVLKQKGFTIHPFNHASKALKALQNTEFDFIITDIQMPDIDGFEFLEKIVSESNTNYKNQPVIAVTGRADLENGIYKQAGFTNVLKKPYSPTDLLETIYAVFNENSPTTAFDQKPKPDKQVSDKPYSLTSLISFLPNDTEALKNVLHSFEITTKDNLFALEKAISEKNIPSIKEISHRMGPMFRQVEANTIGKILADLELTTNSPEEAESLFKTLHYETELLFALFRRDSVI